MEEDLYDEFGNYIGPDIEQEIEDEEVRNPNLISRTTRKSRSNGLAILKI